VKTFDHRDNPWVETSEGAARRVVASLESRGGETLGQYIAQVDLPTRYRAAGDKYNEASIVRQLNKSKECEEVWVSRWQCLEWEVPVNLTVDTCKQIMESAWGTTIVNSQSLYPAWVGIAAVLHSRELVRGEVLSFQESLILGRAGHVGVGHGPGLLHFQQAMK
jgi:hypothetical protein